MFPVLFRFGEYTAYTYGFVVFWAYSIPFFLAWRETRRLSISPKSILLPAYLAGMMGLAGARGMGMIIHEIRHPGAHDLEFLLIHSGSAYFGGLVAGLLFCFAYARMAKLQFWRLLDFAAPYLALGEGLGRIGCFFAGCCFGIPYDGPLAMPGHAHGTSDASGIFPWQPTAMLVGFALFWILISMRKRAVFQGQIGLVFLALYSLSRGLLEFLRGDSVRGLWFGGALSSSQILSLILLSGSVALMVWKWKRPSLPAMAEGRRN